MLILYRVCVRSASNGLQKVFQPLQAVPVHDGRPSGTHPRTRGLIEHPAW
jgi:hypothetical protein